MPTMRSPERFSQKRSVKMSQQLNSSTFGSHQMHTRVGKRNRMNASDMHISNARRGRRASRGVVSNLGPTATAGGSASYARRVSSGRGYNQGVRQVAFLKNAGLIVFLLMLVLAVGAFVATRAYFGLVGGRMALTEDSPKTYLTAATANSPYYTLFVADLDETNNSNQDADLIVLARMDEQGKALTCLSVPADLKVTLSDGASHLIKEAPSVGGYGELVRAVVTLSDADIAHVVILNQKNIEDLVTSWGGLSWNVKEEVDDPRAGKLYIPSGEQTLNAEQTLTLLRATNFSKGVEQRGLNQCQFVSDFVEKMGRTSLMDAASCLDQLSYQLHTDWNAEALLSTIQSYGGYQASSAYAAFMPCYQTGTTEDSPYTVSATQWQAMMALTSAGEDPAKATATSTSHVDPGSFTIMVKNGSGISGGASSIANTLVGLGYDVTDTGNADSYVYTETLVIYLDDDHKDSAQSVVNALGLGRVVDGTNHYVFDTDVMVVLGSDWMPQS